jgi:hypothetical protein
MQHFFGTNLDPRLLSPASSACTLFAIRFSVPCTLYPVPCHSGISISSSIACISPAAC